MKGRNNPDDVLTVKGRIDVEGFIGRVKCGLGRGVRRCRGDGRWRARCGIWCRAGSFGGFSAVPDINPVRFSLRG